MATGMLGALVLVVLTVVIARVLARASHRREQLATSFAGGVSVSFVVLELFVELVDASEHAHAALPLAPEPMQTLALVLLAGLVSFVVVHVLASRAGDREPAYLAAVTQQTLFAVVVGVAVIDEAHEAAQDGAHQGARALALLIGAMALHLGVTDERLAHAHPALHRGLPRAIVVTAPLGGAALGAALPYSQASFAIALALIAGGMLFVALREELPAARDTRLAAFLAGVVVYGALIKTRWWL